MCILDLHQSTQPQVVANITVSDSPILSAAAIPTKFGSSVTVMAATAKKTEGTPKETKKRAMEQLGPTISITSVTSSDSRDSSNSIGSHDSHVIVSRASSISSVDEVITVLKSESHVGFENGNETELQNLHASDEKLPQSKGPDVVEESLNAMSKNQRQTGEQPPQPTLKTGHGFRRVRSNSAPSFPDAQTIAQEVARKHPSPLINSTGGRAPPKRSESTSRLWSPLSLLHSDLNVEGGGRDHCMWLGTEGGKILIYSAGSNLRSRSNRETITLSASVHCIR